MPVHKIKNNVHTVGTIDWDKKLFDSLIPLPDGTSYNSYLVQGSEKTAIIDTSEIDKRDEFLENIWKVNPKTIDYIVSNHAEQDHSGLIPDLLELFPNAKVVTNTKCKNFLKDLMDIEDEAFHIVENGDKLSLGDKTLRFIFTPWTHWPETMVTYLEEDKILFSCDLFGSHHATTALYCSEGQKTYLDTKRYYAEIMMPFRNHIKKHMDNFKSLDVEIIAPSHGPLHKNPSFIAEAYREWISDDTKNEVTIAYVSMHGSTEIMVKYLLNQLVEKGIKVNLFNLAKVDLGELAMSLVDTSTLVLGSSMVLSNAHPFAINAAYLANILRPKTKNLAIIGSFGWGGQLVDTLKGLLSNFKADILEPVLAKGTPKEETFKALDNLANEIAEKHNAMFNTTDNRKAKEQSLNI